MKIRIGFVSNSSSSSFCIFGQRLCVSGFEKMEDLEKIADELDLGLNFWIPYFIYVGRSYSEIRDDETGKEFREGVKEDLEKLFKAAEIKDEIKPETLQMEWAD